MAPEPNVLASPVTVAEWQSLAQLSTLFVPKAVLTIFWKTKLSSFGAREQEQPAMASLPYSFLIALNLEAINVNASSQVAFWRTPSFRMSG